MARGWNRKDLAPGPVVDRADALPPPSPALPDMVKLRRPAHLANGGPTEAECHREHLLSWRRNGFVEVE